MGTFDVGLELRKQVLGSESVDAKLRDVDAFNRDIQRLVTEFAWGTVWSREGLSLRDRSLINLGMLTALNRPHELRSHVRGALNNGCTATEIRETLIQTAVYCGFPAALDAFRVARDELHAASDKGAR